MLFQVNCKCERGRFHPSDSCLPVWWGPEPIPSQNCCSYASNHTLSSRSHQHGPFWILSLFHSLRALGKLEFVWKGSYGNTVSRVGIFMTLHILGLSLYLFLSLLLDGALKEAALIFQLIWGKEIIWAAYIEWKSILFYKVIVTKKLWDLSVNWLCYYYCYSWLFSGFSHMGKWRLPS